MPLREAVHPVAAGFPRLGDIVRIAEVLERAAERILEVPEVRGRKRMPAGSDLGLPAAPGKRHAAAEDLVHVANLERDVMQIGLAGPALQEEEVMVLAALRPAQ